MKHKTTINPIEKQDLSELWNTHLQKHIRVLKTKMLHYNAAD